MTHKPNISKNERSAASNRWRHAANIKHGLAIIAFVACILPASNLCGQNIAIKSNLLYDLTTTLNMGGEVRCDDTHTISLSLNYNPWNFGGNKKMKHFLLQPEYRKWFNEVFTGSFIGFQLHYALFNFGGMLPWGFNNGKMLPQSGYQTVVILVEHGARLKRYTAFYRPCRAGTPSTERRNPGPKTKCSSRRLWHPP